MPTILRIDGFLVMIMPNDHRPPHVHIFRAEGHLRIAIGDEENRPKLMEAFGMSNKDIKKALDIVITHQTKLIEAWRKIHG